MKNHDHIYSGFVIMTIGVLLLLGNLGYISWSILGGLAQIWPLIIVAVGINLFFNNHVLIRILTWTGLIAALLVVGTIFPRKDWDIHFNFNNFGFRTGEEVKVVTKQFSKEDKVNSAELNLQIPAGELEISGQDTYLMNARFPGPENNLKVDTLDNGARKVFTQDGGGLVLGKGADGNTDWRYSYGLYEGIPWNLKIDAGATDANLDLRDVVLKNLELNSGAGDIDLKIGKVDWKATVAADVKASDFKIVLPEGTGFRADIRGGIHDVSIAGEDYTKEGDVYISNNYATAAQKVDINLDVAVGDIQIAFE